MTEYEQCDRCHHKEFCECHSKTQDRCAKNGYEDYKPITNYDRIVSKTPEEMADFLDKIDPVFWTRDVWLSWLQKEAEE